MRKKRKGKKKTVNLWGRRGEGNEQHPLLKKKEAERKRNCPLNQRATQTKIQKNKQTNQWGETPPHNHKKTLFLIFFVGVFLRSPLFALYSLERKNCGRGVFFLLIKANECSGNIFSGSPAGVDHPFAGLRNRTNRASTRI